MPSIVNGLFSGRSGISSHGTAIAVVGDNISNSSTVGYKTSRAEFQDLIAGGQTASKVVGSGSSISAVSTIFEQGTLEYSGRPLDLAVDGNGFFVLAKGQERYYTRAGNFRLDEEGYVVNQNGFQVLGFMSGGSGALEALNINTVSQNQVATTEAVITGNVDASADTVDVATIDALAVSDMTAVSGAGSSADLSTSTYSQLNALAEFSTVVDVFDAQGGKHTTTFFFFHTGQNEYTVRGFASSGEVDPGASPTEGLPRQLGSLTLTFGGDGGLTSVNNTFSTTIPWNSGADPSTINFDLSNFTQFSSASSILSITQNGKGIGTVGSVSIEKNGDIYALLNNGQSAIIGTVGLVNFSNPEGLLRIGGTLLQQAPGSGEPVIGKPKTGTFGAIQSGSLELSTVDIASEFVKLITLQRGFQANSRIITTVNQLLNEIIQLA